VDVSIAESQRLRISIQLGYPPDVIPRSTDEREREREREREKGGDVTGYLHFAYRLRNDISRSDIPLLLAAACMNNVGAYAKSRGKLSYRFASASIS